MQKRLKKVRDVLIIALVLIAGGLTLAGVGVYGDYARHDRALHHQQ